MKIKYSHYRIDVSPQRSDYGQTDRFILPVIALYSDGKLRRMVGLFFAWWKWKIHFFFTTGDRLI